jgi:integral membrane protein (TIGR01906 family)
MVTAMKDSLELHLIHLIQWLLVPALPIFFLAADLHIVTGHWFVRWEYGKAGFPPDPFGLPTAERAYLAQACVDYLTTDASLSLLADLRLSSGQPAFNERELRHMADVQAVYNSTTKAGMIAALVLLGGTLSTLSISDSTRRSKAQRRAASALLGGSSLTLGLLGAVGAYMAVSWNEFFTTFHRIFFEGESWIFPHSNTLIRLFPTHFWMDVAAVVVGLLVVQAIIVGTIGWIWRRQLSPDSPKAQSAEHLA